MSYARLALCGAALAALMSPGVPSGALAQEQTAAAAAPATGAERPEPLSEDELEELVARIALYPDDLVALVCAASLFPLQIVEAERFLEKREKDKSLQPKEEWDGSVISLLNYPEVVAMMSEDLEWTQALGDALANQQKEVLTAIQQLRDEAVAKEIIKTDDKVKVVSSGDNIVIEPATPEKIYVPRYEPEMLYVENYAPQPVSYYADPYPNYYWPSAGFWAGAVTGGLFAAAIDWDDWGVWGGGWGNDVDLDIDCNNCLNGVNGKVDWNDVDWRNVDRSKIDFDRSQIANIDRTKIRDGIKANGANSLRDKADNVRRERVSHHSERTARAQDVRKSAVDRTQRPGGDRPRATPQGSRQNVARADGGARPKASSRPSGKAKAGSRPSGKPKAGARADKRPKKPSAVGSPNRGKTARQHSSRGRQSVGGGNRGGGRQMRGGGHRGGGGMRGGGRGGGGRGGRR